MGTDLNSLLQAERQHLEAEQADLQEQLQQAKARFTVVQERLEHVRALLGEESAPRDRDSRSQALHDCSNNRSSHICDIAEEILSERNGEPMYYKDLAGVVIKRGGALNGETPWTNLTARLVQDPRFVRPTAKGFYALRRDYPNARNVGARLRGSRRRGA